jgi:adenine-specific DNA-methyltransferase
MCHFQPGYQRRPESVFVEQSYSLLVPGGMLGFITPNNWLTIDSFAPLRRFILEQTGNVKIVNILDRVFQAANVDTAVVIFTKGSSTDLTVSELENGRETFTQSVSTSVLGPPAHIIQISLLKDPRNLGVVSRIERCSMPLNDFATVSTGLKAYQTGKGKPRQSNRQKEGRVFHATSKRDENYGPYLDGVDVCRYYLSWSGQYLSYGDWLAEPRRSVPFSGPRLLVRQIPSKPPNTVLAAFTDAPFYNDINSMVVFEAVGGVALKYLLGLINSVLLSFWFVRTFDKLQRRIFPQFKVKELAAFPIRTINFSDPADVARHDRMVALVERMLDLHKRLPAAQTPNDKTLLQRQIDATDHEIDRLVYELYGLTDEEIAVVEGKA